MLVEVVVLVEAVELQLRQLCWFRWLCGLIEVAVLVVGCVC